MKANPKLSTMVVKAVVEAYSSKIKAMKDLINDDHSRHSTSKSAKHSRAKSPLPDSSFDAGSELCVEPPLKKIKKAKAK